MLTDGFHDVPKGHVATVVTHLEMRAAAPLRGRPALDGITLRHAVTPDPDWYRALFRRVGEPWLWFSRLSLSDAELTEIVHDPLVQVLALEKDGIAEGLLELDFRTPDECELAYFGVSPALIGAGAGGWMMDQAISRAWTAPIGRFHVHTCSMDSPGALDFYQRSGFKPVRQQIEIAPDPRQIGLLPQCAGVLTPIIKA